MTLKLRLWRMSGCLWKRGQKRVLMSVITMPARQATIKCIFSVKHRFKTISLLLWAKKCKQWQSNCAAVIRFHFHKTKRRWSGKSTTWCYIWRVSFECNINHLMGNKMYIGVLAHADVVAGDLCGLQQPATRGRWRCLAFDFWVTVTLHIFIHSQIAYSWVLWWRWIRCLNLPDFFSQQSKKNDRKQQEFIFLLLTKKHTLFLSINEEKEQK